MIIPHIGLRLTLHCFLRLTLSCNERCGCSSWFKMTAFLYRLSHNIVTLMWIATFRPLTAGLHQAGCQETSLEPTRKLDRGNFLRTSMLQKLEL